ncbi:MAG: hypothetical protein LQ346_001879 [Caloplaca aetnensis]|nr:MAG: hypothetical protein LQ346_001879 [Caloplaca aetnensis]
MAATNPNPSSTDDRARLKAHFDIAHTSHPDRWIKLWDAGDFLPWDRGTSNPALVDLLDQRRDLIGDCFVEDAGKRRRKRALVPGCGKGYDVLLLASYGYDAYGLEVSEKAVERCIEERDVNGDKYPVKYVAAGAGKSTFVQGDFFADAWSAEVVGGGTFEMIYDYTHLAHPGRELPYDDSGHVKVESSERSDPEGLERIDHWQPERTHAIGKDTDWISVWRHR